MNSRRFPSGSRMYTLDPSALRPPWRGTGPSTMAVLAPSSQALRAAAVPSHTKQKSPQGGFAAGARSENVASCQRAGRWKLIIWLPM